MQFEKEGIIDKLLYVAQNLKEALVSNEEF